MDRRLTLLDIVQSTAISGREEAVAEAKKERSHKGGGAGTEAISHQSTHRSYAVQANVADDGNHAGLGLGVSKPGGEGGCIERKDVERPRGQHVEAAQGEGDPQQVRSPLGRERP